MPRTREECYEFRINHPRLLLVNSLWPPGERGRLDRNESHPLSRSINVPSLERVDLASTNTGRHRHLQCGRLTQPRSRSSLFDKAPGRSYAILSHIWADEEVTFQDMANPADAAPKKGWAKIKRTCEIARTQYRQNYVWDDTRCMDKSSSAELSEAINSMFTWYEMARVCTVYLENCDVASLEEVFSSRWFTRGWKLQELITPRYSVIFYNLSWAQIGARTRSFEHLSRFTRIHQVALEHPSGLKHFLLPEGYLGPHIERPQESKTRHIASSRSSTLTCPSFDGEGRNVLFARRRAALGADYDLGTAASSPALLCNSHFWVP